MTRQNKLPIGIEFYKQIIDKNYYYVDKTLMIKDILDRGGQVNLFTRPRRFGKTLTLTMLKTFFEAEIDRDGVIWDNRSYFEGKKIMDAGEEYTKHLGQYPVIFLSLKSAKQPNFEMAYSMLKRQIGGEFSRHSYVLQSDKLNAKTKERYQSILDLEAGMDEYAVALAFLSECLERHHGRKTIILLDEYDVPLENSYFEGFYEQMIAFLRSLFESCLKTNASLEFSIITGCLRISKESIFTGLNNLKVISILNDKYAERFGFIQSEVEEMLAYYGISEKTEEMKKWYDGYLFGNTEVYNPWSVINYVDDAISQSVFFPKPYWSNTSSNSIIMELVEYADNKVKDEIEGLIAGGTIEKQIHEDITYADIHQSQDNLWNFLFFTGYLKAVSQRFEVDTIYLTMKIPNAEILYIYRNTIQEWFEQKIKLKDLSSMYRAMLAKEPESFEIIIRRELTESISYFDEKEAFYHGFMLGLLKTLQGYRLLSNRESGNGRPDILLEPLDERHPAVILEFKYVNSLTQLDNGCEEALEQIKVQQYEEGLIAEGYCNVVSYGICFCKKSCRVKLSE